MPAFRVQLNGKKVSTMGLDHSGVLTAIVSWIGRADEGPRTEQAGSDDGVFELCLGGLDTSIIPHEHVRWANRKLKVGDVLNIRIVDDVAADRPLRYKSPDPAKDLRAQKAYVKMMAKKLGWKIRTK